MHAEQFVDALSVLSGQWQNGGGFMRQDGRKQGGQVGAVSKVIAANLPPPKPIGKIPMPPWIWDQKNAAANAPLETIYLRKTFMLESKPTSAPGIASCDNEFILYVNGKRAVAGKNWSTPTRFDLARNLRKGSNTLAVQATNIAAGPAGFILGVQLGETYLTTDDSWLTSKQKHIGWEKSAFEIKGWKHAARLGPTGIGPWNLAGAFGGVPGAANISEIRAVLSRLDPLQRALGRPNRDQVVTARDTLPTLLQALELTNGTALDNYLKRAATHWQQKRQNPDVMISKIYLTALGREPNRAERTIASETLDEQPTPETIADLLWITVMLPEFQLIQ
jgi:hypothetical protein